MSGSVNKVILIGNLGADPEIKSFLAKVVIDENGCWNWTGANKGNGYGHTSRGPAHRRSFQIFVGTIPEGHDVCHKCDNRACVNPGHLFTGTRLENMRDCVAKGRQARGDRLKTRKGDKSQFAKLSWDDVRAIRASTAPAKQLAAQYKVSSDNINRIRRNETWKEAA